MEARWSFTAACPKCGVALEHVTGSAAHHSVNLDARAVARCPECADTFILELTLRSERQRRATVRSLPHHDTSGRFAPRPKALTPLPLEVPS